MSSLAVGSPDPGFGVSAQFSTLVDLLELGEIESVFRRHEQVQEAIVVARDQEGEEKRLVAYVIANQPARVSELRAWLRERLPEFMTPAAFVLMDALPLTPNGKIDRKALPAPDFSNVSEESQAAPRTQIEEVLLGIWANVLGIKELGIHDNFFELGGHSLMATRLISQVRNELHVEVPVSKVFESPTVARLAEHVEQTLRDAPAVVYTPIELLPRDQPLPLSFAQQRLWFLDQMEPGNPFYNIAAVVRLNGKLSVDALERSIGEIVNRHEVLRTRLEVVDDQPVQIVTPALSWTLVKTDLREFDADERESEVARRAAEEAQTPFDLSTGGLLRTSLLQLSEEEHALLVTMHHIVSDAWSVGIFVRDLSALYSSFVDELDSQLPALNVQYADFSRWQQQWFCGDVLATQMAYWKQHLAGAPALLNFPTDRPRPAVQKFQGESQTLVLSRALAESLKILSRRQGATLFMTLLAGFKTLLFRYTGQEDIVVGTPVAGRNRADIESLSFVPTPVAEPMLALEWSNRTKLRMLLTGGDRLHTWPASSLPFAVVNNYGPTENAVVSTSGLISREGGAPGTAPSLGRPISNVGIYIVDQRGEPVPVGVTGELWVGGGSLARCYLHRPELSAELFVPDALSGRSGASLYRTGDLAPPHHAHTSDSIA